MVLRLSMTGERPESINLMGFFFSFSLSPDLVQTTNNYRPKDTQLVTYPVVKCLRLLYLLTRIRPLSM